jgi:hypothetical protein
MFSPKTNQLMASEGAASSFSKASEGDSSHAQPLDVSRKLVKQNQVLSLQSEGASDVRHTSRPHSPPIKFQDYLMKFGSRPVMFETLYDLLLSPLLSLLPLILMSEMRLTSRTSFRRIDFFFQNGVKEEM